jgi:hypothetical protein
MAVKALLAALLLAVLGAVPSAASAAGMSTDAWLSGVLGVPVSERADLVASGPGLVALDARGLGAYVPCAALTEARYRSQVLSAQRRPRDPDYAGVWFLHLHEHLHMLGDTACDFDADLEEGFTEAVTFDLWPAFAHRFLSPIAQRARFQPGAPYRAWVLAVRRASARATGAPWNSRAARLWRRQGLFLPRAELRSYYEAAAIA